MNKVKSLVALLFLFSTVALFSENVSALKSNASEPQLIYLPNCDTLDDLEKFVDNDFVIPQGSSCVIPSFVFSEPKKAPMSFERNRALGLNGVFDRNPWQFGGTMAKKIQVTGKPAAFFTDANYGFEGAKLLYNYGASSEYIYRLNELFESGKEIFDVNASLKFITDSDRYTAWTSTNGNGYGDVTVAFYNSSNGRFLDLNQLEVNIIYHELSHIAFAQDFGEYDKAEVGFGDLADLMWFEEYVVDELAERTMPLDKVAAYVEGIKSDEENVSYKDIQKLFVAGEYGILVRSKAKEKTHSATKADEYIDFILERAPVEFRQKFLALSDEFYTRAQNLNKENFEENVKYLAQKFSELRQDDY